MNHSPIELYEEMRPWGHFVEFIRNTACTVKILEVKNNESLSLQSHRLRDEFWYVLSGEGSIVIDETEHAAKPGFTCFIPRGSKHRATGSADLRILELALGDAQEGDIVRFEDKYGRMQDLRQ